MEADERNKLITLYLAEQREALERYPIKEVGEAADAVWNSYRVGGTVFACGNGGNAASISNLITDLANHVFVTDDKTKPLPLEVPRLRTVDLCSSGAAITANLNDFGPQYIFSQQLVTNCIGTYDVVFGYSGSGNSPNIVEAFKVAKDKGAKTIAVTRNRESKIVKLADIPIVFEGTSRFPGQVGSNDFNFHYEDFGFGMAHVIVGLMRKRITDTYGNGNKGS